MCMFAASSGDPEAVPAAARQALSRESSQEGNVGGELQATVALWQRSWHSYQQARAEVCQRQYGEQQAHSEVV